jgi:hypothetical protein
MTGLILLVVLIVTAVLAALSIALPSLGARVRAIAPRRAAMAAVAFATLALAGAAFATPISGFFTWSGTGNGRGGQSAAKPACTNDFRGRTWALYGSSSASSDQFQVCIYTSGGGNAWVAVPR